MFKVLIVDDEEWIRLGLREQIGWTDLNMEIIGEAHNGEKALGIILRSQPDIVVTDIRMPVMDGIELMEKTHKLYPEIIFIVLSGYSDFEYARKAINLNALDYILKPIEEKNLEDALKKAADKIYEKRNALKELNELKDRLNESVSIAKERFLTSLIYGFNKNKKLVFDNIKKFEINIKHEWMAVLAIKVCNMEEVTNNKFNSDYFISLQYICDLIKKCLPYNECIIFKNYYRLDEFIVAKGIEDPNPDNNKLSLVKLAENIKTCLNENFGCIVSVGIGRPCCGIGALDISYGEALKALRNAGLITVKGIAHIDDIESKNDYYLYPDDKEKNFLYYLEKGNKPQIFRMIEELFVDFAKRNGINPESLKNTILELIIGIEKILKKHGLKDLLNESLKAAKAAVDADSMDNLKKCIEILAENTVDYINYDRRSCVKKAVDEIVCFIERNYNKEISLSSIADMFFLNPAYLSRMFKNETGKNFNDYLTGLRMGKACELLKCQDLKMNDVAYMIGYENLNYFFKKFKDYYGDTPSEYRKKYLNKQ